VDSDRINRWLALIANIGIIIGLFLVVFEIQQNSELIRLQFINDDLLATADSEIPMLGDNPADVMTISIYNPADMTYTDYRIVDAYLTQKMEFLVRRYRLGQEGILDEDAWKTVGFAYGWYFGHEFGRLWWENEGRSAYSHIPGLVEYVDQMVGELNDQASTESWLRIQSQIGANPN